MVNNAIDKRESMTYGSQFPLALRSVLFEHSHG